MRLRATLLLAAAFSCGSAIAAGDPIAAIAGTYELRLGDAPGCDLVLKPDPVDAAKATPDAPHVMMQADPACFSKSDELIQYHFGMARLSWHLGEEGAIEMVGQDETNYFELATLTPDPKQPGHYTYELAEKRLMHLTKKPAQ